MRLFVIDNYDSFTYNIVQYFGELGAEQEVVRNDAIGIDDLKLEGFDGLVISPGPCDPDKAGISLQAIERWAGKIPLLGVCLGHQSIGQAFGGKIIGADKLMHGKTSSISHDEKDLFKDMLQGLPPPVTTLWLSSGPLFPSAWKSPQHPRTMRSWESVTASSPSGAYSSIRSRSRQKMEL